MSHVDTTGISSVCSTGLLGTEDRLIIPSLVNAGNVRQREGLFGWAMLISMTGVSNISDEANN